MSTKKETKTSIDYNQAGMQNYNAFQQPLNEGLSNFAKNPLQSSYFQNAYNMSLAQNQRAQQGNMSTIMNNFKTVGGGGMNMPGFQQSLMNQSSRMGSLANSNAFNTHLMNAVSNQKWALASMQNYNPLQTGQTTTEKTSGTGTWLPQVVGAGLGVAGAAMTGGLSTMAGWGKMLGGMSGNNAFAGSSASNGGNSYWNQQPRYGTPPFVDPNTQRGGPQVWT
jgi:hypothetical protein